MSVYLGEIEIRNHFVNFKPLYSYSDESFTLLTRFDAKSLLPLSRDGQINFYTNPSEDPAKDIFTDGEYILFDFELEELEDNYYRGERNLTGYKVNVSELAAGKLRRLPDLGYYYCVPVEHIDGNYKTNTALIITDPNVFEGMKVMLPIPGNNEILLGPFDVNFREYDNQCIVKNNFASHKYIVEGYKFGGGYESIARVFGTFGNERKYVKIGGGYGRKTAIDVLPKESLLKSFRDAIAGEGFIDGKIDLENIEVLVEQHKTSLFTGDDIPEEVRKQRLESLTNLLTDEEKVNDTELHPIC